MIFLLIVGLAAAYVGLQVIVVRRRRGEYARMKSRLAPKESLRIIKGGK